jgi:hypothetical protein
MGLCGERQRSTRRSGEVVCGNYVDISAISAISTGLRCEFDVYRVPRLLDSSNLCVNFWQSWVSLSGQSSMLYICVSGYAEKVSGTTSKLVSPARRFGHSNRNPVLSGELLGCLGLSSCTATQVGDNQLRGIDLTST